MIWYISAKPEVFERRVYRGRDFEQVPSELWDQQAGQWTGRAIERFGEFSPENKCQINQPISAEGEKMKICQLALINWLLLD